MPYTPPSGNAVNFQFPAGTYTPPLYNAVEFQWAPEGPVATLTATEAPDTGAGTAEVVSPIVGVLTATESPDTSEAAAGVAVLGGSTISEGADSLTAIGTSRDTVGASAECTEAGDATSAALGVVLSASSVTVEFVDTLSALASVVSLPRGALPHDELTVHVRDRTEVTVRVAPAGA